MFGTVFNGLNKGGYRMKALVVMLILMTFVCALTTWAEEIPEIGKGRVMKTWSEADQEIIRREVRDQFNLLISAVNQMNACAWSEYYSKDGFLSAFAGTDYFGTRREWVDTITSYFSKRDSQHLEPLSVHVTPLAFDMALMTSQERSEVCLKSGQTTKFTHVFTMIWKKEQSGWKILHSHESWIDEQVK